MRRILTILVLTGIAVENFPKAVIYIQYEIGQEYIAKNLCIMRNDPMNTCQGRCYLKKQLLKENKRERSSPAQNSREFKDLKLFFQYNIQFSFIQTFTGRPNFGLYHFIVKIPPNFEIFHPPQIFFVKPFFA